ARKTAVHRACKLAPQDMRMSLANSVEDEEEGGNAVLAEGLNPADFKPDDLNLPLVETGREAAQDVAKQKIEESARTKSIKGLPNLKEWPEDQLDPKLGLLIKVAGVVYQRENDM